MMLFQNPAFKQFQEGHEPEFESLGLSRDIQTQIYELGFQKPTAIQVWALTITNTVYVLLVRTQHAGEGSY